LLTASLLSAGAAGETNSDSAWLRSWRAANPAWRGVHLAAGSDRDLDSLNVQLPHLTNAGVNVIVLEVDYSFDIQSHPELRPSDPITKARAQSLARASRQHGVRLIPQINCLGHQSWAKHTGALLQHHPQLDETPGQFPENKGIYCRSWCPQNPEVNPIVFALIDELIDAFEADAFHVGMDEAFLIASEHCPRCRGGDPAKLFAKAVIDLHGHIVEARHCEMLLWGDRLLDAKALGYSEWEASKNQTAGAIDLIPHDVIVCDWHYEKRAAYPSVPLLLAKGFRVWPSGWQPLEAARAFSAFARAQKHSRMLGYLATTWSKVKISGAAEWPPLVEPLALWR
jgi:hypothetical protein